jgi:hypothetical protein
MTLWGKQKMGFGGKNASFDGNTLVLKKSATVKKASGNAGTFSIWSGGRSILTVHSMKDIIGKTLQPGKYVIRPGLSKGQSEATVTLTLE